MTSELKVCNNPDVLSRQCANYLVERIQEVVRAEGICSIVLSGGSTPLPLYRLLARELAEEIPWNRVHLFWGDERFVSRDDEASNFGVAAEIFEPLGLRRAQIHPIPVRFPTPEEAAIAYEHELRLWSHGEIPVFDICLLGLGEDGHVASLFPDTRALQEDSRLVVATRAPVKPRDRITLTLPVLNAAREVHFLIAGESKNKPLKTLLGMGLNGADIPALRIQPRQGKVVIWADQAAAK